MNIIQFPFSAIEGQDDFKLCLVLNVIDPAIAGVLATGDKGTGKTTTVRALSQLMGTDFPFVNLPIGATEDRVLGSVNLDVLLREKRTQVDKGILAKAHHGFLYVDEINLLNEYLMDVLLDASASGGYYLEREGVSQWLASRFCLVGTMNPEEGALRPQLLDRFGLHVVIKTPKDITLRKKIATYRLDFDMDPEGFLHAFQEKEKALKEKILLAKNNLTKVVLPEEVKEFCANITLQNQVEGMRADILLLKTARAYAAFLGEEAVTTAMVSLIAPFVLQHRAKDYQPPSNNDTPNDQAPSEKDTDMTEKEENTQASSLQFQLPEAVTNELKFTVNTVKKKEVELKETKGLQQEFVPNDNEKSLAIFKTIKAHIITGKGTPVYKYNASKRTLHIVFLVDTSASMAPGKQMGYLKGVILNTMKKNPLKKIKYAIVALYQNSAKIMQPFTTNTQAITEKSYELKTVGKTNLKEAFLKVSSLLKPVHKKTVQLFVFTDGRINTGGAHPFEEAVHTYKSYLGSLQNTMIVDTEAGFVKLGRAKRLADALQVNYQKLLPTF